MWVFFSFTQCVKVAQLVFGFLTEGTVPYIAVDLVCPWQEASSGFFYIATLIQNAFISFFLFALLIRYLQVIYLQAHRFFSGWWSLMVKLSVEFSVQSVYSSAPKYFFVVLCFLSLLNFSFYFYIVFLIALNYLCSLVGLWESLEQLFWTFLLSNSWISILLGPITGGLL